MKESQIEKLFVKMVQERGGMCLKFISPGMPGVPDRIVLTPSGKLYFIELKTEIGRMANIQKWVAEQMRKRGADVRTVYGLGAVKNFVEEVLPREV